MLRLKVLLCGQDRQDEQAHRVVELEQQVAALQREKREVEAHADILERALMKMSMEKAQVQVGSSCLPCCGGCGVPQDLIFTCMYVYWRAWKFCILASTARSKGGCPGSKQMLLSCSYPKLGACSIKREQRWQNIQPM